ncbi:MAG: threonine synthase [Euryarchaeota archaeon]|nr:threonine synthase [Euryarchaeota archaeon]
MAANLTCIECTQTYPLDEKIYTCKNCGGLLEVRIDIEQVKKEVTKSNLEKRELGVWRYFEFLPIKNKNKIVSLKEGGTPLYKCSNLARDLGLKNLYAKFEGANPSGSFKDRGITVGISRALELDSKAVACASTGNTAASLAMYAAKAAIKCYVLLPVGKVALGKLSQALLHGAQVISIKGNFDRAFAMVRELCEKYNIYLLNSINPFRLEGQKTLAFEVVNQLNWIAPDRLIVPVGNAGNISAIYKGFCEFRDFNFIEKVPIMIGIQANGASPIVKAIERKLSRIVPETKPETVASAIRIGNPVNAPKALKAIRESGGLAESVNDEEIIAAQKMLARKEGILCEPASAASVAGLKKLKEAGKIDSDETIVCVLTGHGLKDPEIILKFSEKPIEIEPNMNELIKFIK